MIVCNQSGECCTFESGPCEFLTSDNRCSLHASWGHLRSIPAWRAAPVGQWFARQHPGSECKDWPQNLPEVMGNPTAGKCCWEVTGAGTA